MTTYEKLQSINDSKNNINSALSNLGFNMTGVAFSEYASRIESLHYLPTSGGLVSGNVQISGSLVVNQQNIQSALIEISGNIKQYSAGTGLILNENQFGIDYNDTNISGKLVKLDENGKLNIDFINQQITLLSSQNDVYNVYPQLFKLYKVQPLSGETIYINTPTLSPTYFQIIIKYGETIPSYSLSGNIYWADDEGKCLSGNEAPVMDTENTQYTLAFIYNGKNLCGNLAYQQ